MDIFKAMKVKDYLKKKQHRFWLCFSIRQVSDLFWQTVFYFFMCFMKKMNQRLCNAKSMFNVPVWYNSGIGGKHVFY